MCGRSCTSPREPSQTPSAGARSKVTHPERCARVCNLVRVMFGVSLLRPCHIPVQVTNRLNSAFAIGALLSHTPVCVAGSRCTLLCHKSQDAPPRLHASLVLDDAAYSIDSGNPFIPMSITIATTHVDPHHSATTLPHYRRVNAACDREMTAPATNATAAATAMVGQAALKCRTTDICFRISRTSCGSLMCRFSRMAACTGADDKASAAAPWALSSPTPIVQFSVRVTAFSHSAISSNRRLSPSVCQIGHQEAET